MAHQQGAYFLCGDIRSFSLWRPFLRGFQQVSNPDDASVLVVNEKDLSQRVFLKVVGPSHVRLFLSEEAVFPDMNLFDYAIGMNNCILDNRMLRIHPVVLFQSYFPESLVALGFSSRKTPGFLERKTCSFIYSNRRAHPMRDEIFHKIQERLSIDSLGWHLNNGNTEFLRQNVPLSWVDQKVEAEKKYRFSIAAENAKYAGYTSEKILTSLVAGTVPIYWGNDAISSDFNPERFINVFDFESIDALVDRVDEINEDSELWSEIANSDWFTSKQRDLLSAQPQQVAGFLSNVFDDGRGGIVRRGIGTFPRDYEELRLRTLRGSLARARRFLLAKFGRLWSIYRKYVLLVQFSSKR